MATQEWTIFTLVGSTLPQLQAKCAALSRSRACDDSTAWSSKEWPAKTARSAAQLIVSLSKSRFSPPVIYYSRHVDLWSSSGELFRFLPQQPPVVAYRNEEFWSYNLPDRGKLKRRIQAARASAKFPETLWLADVIGNAANAYKNLFNKSLLLIHRRVLTASPTDVELVAKANRPFGTEAPPS